MPDPKFEPKFYGVAVPVDSEAFRSLKNELKMWEDALANDGPRWDGSVYPQFGKAAPIGIPEWDNSGPYEWLGQPRTPVLPSLRAAKP